MPQAPSNPPAAPAAPRATLPLVLLVLAICFFSWRTYDYFVPTFFGIADEHGYLTTAKRLATTGHFELHQGDPYAFIGETMMQSPKPGHSEDYYLRQPIGYPLLCAAAYAVGEQGGPFSVNPMAGLALLIGVYLLGRQLGNPLAGALAAAVLAAHPVVLYYTIKPLSHVPDMAIGVWTLIAALAWRNKHTLSHAALVGLALGYAILIRYTNVLLVFPLALILFERRREFPLKRLLAHAALAAGITSLAIVALLFYHKAAFDDPFRTGYWAGGNSSAFSLDYFFQHTPAMLQCIAQPSTGLTLLLALVMVGVVILGRRERFLLAFLLAWALPMLILNTAYYGKPRDNLLLYTRFALASYVPLLLLAFCWQRFLADRRKILRVLTPAVALASLTWTYLAPDMTPPTGTMTTLDHTRFMCRLMLAASDLALAKAPPGSIILADTYTDYYLDYIDAYTIYSPNMFDPAKIQKRLSDLDQLPHEFDPARTRQISDLVGRRSSAELDVILRRQFNAYLAINRRVFVLATDDQIPAWQSRLKMPMTPVAQNVPLQLGLYELSPAR